MTPKQARGLRTAEQLLDAALAVHDREGRPGFTVQAVRAESGVSLGSLYHHFGSFDGLSAALYRRCMGELLDALVDALRGADGARAGIEALVRRYLEFAGRHRAEARFVHTAADATFLRTHAEDLARDKAPRVEAMLGWLAPHVASGAIVDLPAPVLELLLIGPPAEAVRRWLGGQPGVDPGDSARVLPARVWRSLDGSATDPG
ncbi:TetR/AcrR family transcriptional regulator [Patulibacter minatonensis]|uniref:TetR/AcrR family transcriptional regulator n=1 Tax=Patulibacter minatonensis TaxID=298163 RepID=UPI000478932C|nr:TetR/AcrR family transcriptional regulator [Patulibacter minatonensis]